MTNEEKQLLLKVLCEGLPYGVMFDRLGHPKKILAICPNAVFPIQCDNGEYVASTYILEDGKPYLRPMSSMTKEEEKEYHAIDSRAYTCPEDIAHIPAADRIDWLNAHHFDFRGLIPMGLAFEATEGMYKDD